jgi:hypothetical protein
VHRRLSCGGALHDRNREDGSDTCAGARSGGDLGAAETSELNVRRCQRYARVLLAHPPTRPEQRLRLLGRSRYWLRMALLGLDRLAEEIDRSSSTADTLDLVLKPTAPTMRPRR